MVKYLKDVYGRMNKVVFFVCLGVSLFLIITAFFVPPTAVIDSSVLAATGELFAFAALYTVGEAVTMGSDIRLQKGDTTIHIDNPQTDNKTENETEYGN